MRSAPGPKGRLILGSLKDVQRDPLGFFLESAKRYGGLVRFRMAYKPLFLVSRPEYIRHVLQDNLKNYAKGVSYESLRSVMGNGLLVAEGDLWRRQRKLMNPLFTRQRFVEKLDVVTACVDRAIAGWKDGATVDLVPEMMRLAFDVVGRTLMGADIADEMREIERVLEDVIGYVYRRMQSPVKLPEKLPTPANLKQRKLMKVLHGVVERTIARRRAAADAGKDVLGLLMSARDDETVEGMSDRQLRDEVLTLLLAGHETTGAALCWTLHLLSKNPDAERRLVDEAAAVLGGRAPAMDDFMKLAYAHRVVQESMRLYPPAWAFTRAALKADTIDGYAVPKGAIVVVSTWVNHRLPEFWDEPEKFDPDRFLPERSASRPTYAYFPFGGGPHSCIGMHLSMLEVLLGTVLISRRWRMEPTGPEVHPEPRISLLPRPAMRMVLRAR